MINRQQTGIFGLPRRGGRLRGGSGARTSRREALASWVGLPNMSGILRSPPDRGDEILIDCTSELYIKVKEYSCSRNQH